jgi:hypothetical protein
MIGALDYPSQRRAVRLSRPPCAVSSDLVQWCIDYLHAVYQPVPSASVTPRLIAAPERERCVMREAFDLECRFPMYRPVENPHGTNCALRAATEQRSTSFQMLRSSWMRSRSGTLTNGYSGQEFGSLTRSPRSPLELRHNRLRRAASRAFRRCTSRCPERSA